MNAENLIFEISRPGRAGVTLPDSDVPEKPIEQLLGGAPLRSELTDQITVADRTFVKLLRFAAGGTEQIFINNFFKFSPHGECGWRS